MIRFGLGVILLAGVVLVVGGCTETGRSSMDWPEREQTHAPWTRWWWMGNAVEPDTLTRLLNTYEAAGIGGVEITPINGVRGEEDQFIEYLSPRWMERLHHTVREAGARDLRVDIATGTGWPFGGPTISPESATRRVLIRSYELAEAERLSSFLRHRSERVDAEAPLQTVMAYSDEGAFATSRIDWAPMPSGVLGPVTVIPATERAPGDRS